MKKIIIALLFVLAGIAYADTISTQFSSGIAKAKGTGTWSNLYDACQSGKPILIDTPIISSTSFTCTAPIYANRGGIITQTTGTLILTSFDGDLSTHFSGTVLFPSGAVKEVFPEWWNAKGDGFSDDTAPILLAIATSKNVRFGSKTYLFSQTISLSDYQSIKGEGVGLSILKKSSGFNGTGLILGSESQARDIQITGDNGNGGDGVLLAGFSASLQNVVVSHQGGNGIAIGKNWTNTNLWSLINVWSNYNGGNGVFIDDPSASGGPNANGGVADRLYLSSNSGDGLKLNRAMLNTFSGIVAEGNTGFGVNIQPGSLLTGYNSFYGGDLEANTAGDLNLSSNAYYNYFSLGNINTTVMDAGGGNVIFLPGRFGGQYASTIYGASTAGTGTYTSQQNRYFRNGKKVDFIISITWTAHTGTGQTFITLPVNVEGGDFDFIPVTILSQNISLPAGSTLVGLIYGPGGNRIQLYTSLNGVLTALNVPASGTLWITGSYVSSN